MNPRDKILRQGIQLYSESWLSEKMLKVSILSKSGCQVLIQSQMKRSNEELNSKGRIENGRQWGSQIKSVFSLVKTSPGRANLWKECVHLFSEVGRVRLSPRERNKSLQLNSRAEWQDPLRQAIMYAYKSNRNEKEVKKTVPTWNQRNSSIMESELVILSKISLLRGLS